MFCFWVLSEDDLGMDVPDWIKDRARILNINSDGMNRFEVIRTIQIREGHTPCYASLSPGAYCPFANDCCWKKDCRGLL